MSSIIVPIDGSPQSLDALRFALTMARNHGDDLVLLSMHSTSHVLGEHMLGEALSIISQESVSYRTKVRVGGNPTIEIHMEANDPDVRCVVMGLRGAGSKDQSIRTLGSVSQGLLKIANYPVTLVPHSVR